MHFVSVELQWDLNTPLGRDLGTTREATQGFTWTAAGERRVRRSMGEEVAKEC